MRADPSLLADAVEESLRLEPAAATIDRYATRDADPRPIRAGDLVSISIAAANRDPAVFADPDRFDIRRENAKLHLAFAHGPHVCIGMHLARLEAHTALRVLLDRLPRTAPRRAHRAARAGLPQAAGAAGRLLASRTRMPSAPASVPALATTSLHGIAAPRRCSPPRMPSIVQPRSSLRSKRAPLTGRPRRGRSALKRTERSRASWKLAPSIRQSSKTTCSSVQAANDARSTRDSRDRRRRAASPRSAAGR